jgi:molybdopterin molybdotransferase
MQYLSVDEALAFTLAAFNPLASEPVAVRQALGRALAEDLFSPLNIPPFTNSAMDGYAVRAVDTGGATPDRPARLRLVAEVAAGQVCDRLVGPGQAVRIMTGAALPQGADAVVRFEDTNEGLFDYSTADPAKGTGTENRAKPEEVRVYIQATPGLNVRAEGEDVRAGRPVLRAGTKLNPGHLGLLAALGITTLRCARRPRVAILATGSELLEPGHPLSPGKIYNSNNPMLAGLVDSGGAEAVGLGAARDDWEVIRARLAEGLRLGVDLILTSGGVSVGDYDLLKQVLQAEGRLEMWQVRMRPGKPLAFGHLGGIPLLGLPGNPLAALVSFELFARPALLKMQGLAPALAPLEAILAEPVSNPSGRRNFLRGKMGLQDASLWVWPGGTHKSSQLGSLIESDCLIVAHEDHSFYAPGERIGIIPLYGAGINLSNRVPAEIGPLTTTGD